MSHFRFYNTLACIFCIKAILKFYNVGVHGIVSVRLVVTDFFNIYFLFEKKKSRKWDGEREKRVEGIKK
jgi:hypothetical protein